jgi:hypothetical protein
MEDVEEAILAEGSGELSDGAVDDETLALARTLLERHRRS